jgi:hypothetical protein
VSEAAQETALHVRECIERWVTQMAGSAGSGRSATTVARMATAKAIAELRGVTLEAEGDEADQAIAEYLRRSRSMLNQAAHDIERNRYSLQQMDTQMHRLDDLAKRIFPDDASEATEEAGPASVEPAGGADDGGADREVSTRQ